MTFPKVARPGGSMSLVQRLGVAAALLSMVSFAGCTDSAGASVNAEPPSATGKFDDTTGAIQALVLSDELVPIPNATVGVQSPTGAVSPASVLSGFDGRVSFSSLAPGKYVVQVVALGYEAGAKVVDVEAGKAAEVRFNLAMLPSDGPYHETIVKTGLVRSFLYRIGPACDTIVQPPIGTCLGIQFSDVTFYRVLGEDWATIVDEAKWTPNSAASHQRAYLFATFPNVTDFSGVPDFKSKGHFEAAGKSPVMLRIDRSMIRDRGFPEESQYGPGPNGRGTRFRAVNDFEDVGVPGVIGVSVMIDQPMTVYNTEFHMEPAPEKWTALPDS